MNVFVLATGYLAMTFICSALIVRTLPRSITSQKIDRHVWTFPAFPLLVLIDLVAILYELATIAVHWPVYLFDTLTGRRRRRIRRKRYYYLYGHGRNPSGSRSDKRSASNPTHPDA
ncbi:MAG: hypothetical protein CL949_24480 [Erythrobacter sp.]|nr:hypothetical protein [Erythrobacter sp.]